MIPLSVVDAFTDRPFAGNPAAVCVLDRWPSDEWLQLVGREMNLSETAFLVRREGNEFDLRWFTPRVEVALCGHATLASAHALWESERAPRATDRRSTREERPTDRRPAGRRRDRTRLPRQARDAVRAAGRARSKRSGRHRGRGRHGTSSITSWSWRPTPRCGHCGPDFGKLAATECRGVIVTARSDDPRFDFVSRFFAPQAGHQRGPGHRLGALLPRGMVGRAAREDRDGRLPGVGTRRGRARRAPRGTGETDRPGRNGDPRRTRHSSDVKCEAGRNAKLHEPDPPFRGGSVGHAVEAEVLLLLRARWQDHRDSCRCDSRPRERDRSDGLEAARKRAAFEEVWAPNCTTSGTDGTSISRPMMARTPTTECMCSNRRDWILRASIT